MSSFNYNYPVDKQVSYSNDMEYRQCIRDLFRMTPQTDVLNNPDLDEITKDETNYDKETSTLLVKWISDETKECYELNELYKVAAATMITLDRETGLAVLFSYDYFAEFHKLLSLYFSSPGTDLEMSSSYERLWNRLTTK